MIRSFFCLSPESKCIVHGFVVKSDSNHAPLSFIALLKQYKFDLTVLYLVKVNLINDIFHVSNLLYVSLTSGEWG